MTTASHAKARKHDAPRKGAETVVRALPAELRRLERVFDEVDWPERRAFLRARRHARERALDSLCAGGSDGDALRTALLVASTELIVGMRSELTASPQDVASLGEQIEEVMGVSRLALAREVLRSPELLSGSPAAALDALVTMLVSLAPLRSVSLWTLDDAEQVQCTCHVGDGNPSRSARELAALVLAGEKPEPGSRQLLGLPLGRWRHPLAALVGSPKPGMRNACRPFLLDAAGMLGAILERDALLAGNAASERLLVESSERKLTRLGFDLHDGPIQDVAVAAQDLRLMGDRLEAMVEDADQRKLVRKGVDQVESQLLSLDSDLRRISHEVRAASVLLNRPFARALRDVAQAFAARTNTEPCVKLRGDLAGLSASQQIALLNIIHEALANIREHSDATKIDICVSANSEGVEAQVIDNGHGFDMESTLIRTAREGRLGLVAMHERVRLLGGQCRIDSQVGGPTVISVSLERWEPVAQEAERTQARA
jgi:signal transduction histidine kinase